MCAYELIKPSKDYIKEIEDFKNSTYTEYLKDPLTYEEKCKNENHINYLKNEFPKKLNWTDDECYKYEAQLYEKDMIDKNGDLLSTDNPNSKWDWYQTGGRWCGYLTKKSGEKTDEDYVSEIVWNEYSIPFAYISPNGVWHERGKMGWWDRVSNEKNKEDWENEFNEFINSLDDNVIVTAVDCHI